MEDLIVLTRTQYQADLLEVAKRAAREIATEMSIKQAEKLLTRTELMDKLIWGKDKLNAYIKSQGIDPIEFQGNNKMYLLSQFTTRNKNSSSS